jgi:hypothetical protein
MCEQRDASTLHPVGSEQTPSALKESNSGEATLCEDDKLSECWTAASQSCGIYQSR